MKKKLEIEMLKVESFQTMGSEHGRGTVHGAQDMDTTTKVPERCSYPIDCPYDPSFRGCDPPVGTD